MSTITLEITESEIKKVEQMLDEFHTTVKRLEANEPTRQERMTKLSAEIELLLSQAEHDLNKIEQLRQQRPQMLWEKSNVE